MLEPQIDVYYEEDDEQSFREQVVAIDTSFPLPAIETPEEYHPRETHDRERTITTFQLVLFT
jgi:hypothetical protein